MKPWSSLHTRLLLASISLALLGTVILTVLTGAVTNLNGPQWRGPAITFVVLTLLFVGSGLWLVAVLRRPLKPLRHALLRLAADLSHRLPESGEDELDPLAAAFNQMAGRLQALIEKERAFASSASHELRNPLTSIRLRSEALQRDNLDEAVTRQYIREIDEDVTRLSNLVDDLILLSRLQAGRARPGREQVDSERLARELVDELRPWIERRNIQMELQVDGGPLVVEGSENHLQVVFRNLLENAIKYTPEGGRVTWRLWQETDTLRAEISDTGQGIELDEIPHLFEPFYRANRDQIHGVPGTGLGLSLTRSILDVYYGRIIISSPGVGQGTNVALWWPLRQEL